MTNSAKTIFSKGTVVTHNHPYINMNRASMYELNGDYAILLERNGEKDRFLIADKMLVKNIKSLNFDPLNDAHYAWKLYRLVCEHYGLLEPELDNDFYE